MELKWKQWPRDVQQKIKYISLRSNSWTAVWSNSLNCSMKQFPVRQSAVENNSLNCSLKQFPELQYEAIPSTAVCRLKQFPVRQSAVWSNSLYGSLPSEAIPCTAVCRLKQFLERQYSAVIFIIYSRQNIKRSINQLVFYLLSSHHRCKLFIWRNII